MNYVIEITETAKSDLRKIALFITEETKNPDIALRFISELRQTCERLKELPNSGTNPKDRILLSLGYKYLIHKDYLIFYNIHVDVKKIYIDAFFNGKMDYVKVFMKRI